MKPIYLGYRVLYSYFRGALYYYGTPNIFNTDQSPQFTSNDFINLLKNNNILISMDGKGCWMDNIFIERLWRSLKYECIYMFDTVVTLKNSISNWFEFYNNKMPYSSFNGITPEEVYYRSNCNDFNTRSKTLAA